MENARYCRNCGHALEADAKFCTECGTAVRRTDPAYSEMDWTQTKKMESVGQKENVSHNQKPEHSKVETPDPVVPKAAQGKASTVEKTKSGEPESKKRKRNIIIASVAACILILAGVAVFAMNMGDAAGDKNLAEGQEYLDAGDYDQAIASFEAVMKEEPESVEARLGLADAYVGMEEYSAAITYLDEALDINDISLDAYGKKADIYTKLDQTYELNKLVHLAVSKNVDLSKDYGYSIPEMPDIIVSDDAYSTVSINGKDKDVTVRYTTDGTDPTERSSIYTSPLEKLSGDVMIKAVAINNKKIWSDVAAEALSLKTQAYSYNKDFTAYLGKTYKELTSSLGELTLVENQDGGSLFSASGSNYIFSFDSEQPAETDHCTTVNTTARYFFNGLDGVLTLEDAEKALGVTLEKDDSSVYCEIGNATIYIYDSTSGISADSLVRCKLTKDVRGE